jgi:hypothetical protein
MLAPIPVPPGGVADLALSWLLAAALIPLFFFGKAYLGRLSGGGFLVVYLGYAVARILYA